ncbi:hypothetical protein HanPI659440_Chr01g0025491 [Helianthus annuus]|nr:hypothetical protein HanPI659440_Chr01g0025491 [Helianthus annuus]
MRKSFIILSSSVKLKRLRRIKSSIKRTSKHRLGQERSQSRSVVIISDSPKQGPSKQQSDFGPTQRELVYDEPDSVSPSHGERRKSGCVESKRGHNKNHNGKKSIAGDSSGCGNKRKRGEKNSADDNSANVMRRNRVTATSKGGTLRTKKKKASEDNVKGEAGKRKLVGNKPEKVQKARKRAKKDEFPGIRTRSAPLQFYKCVRALTEQQRDAVRQMAFGRLLTFSVDGLPAKLGYFVVDNFNPDKMVICTPAGDIKVNRKVIHKLLGILTGGQKISSIDKLPMLIDAIADWRARYSGVMVPPTQM